jgi:hypothetical protein
MFLATKKIPLELLFFSAALVLLFFLDDKQPHVSLCPLAAIDFKYCPGCGLGHAIHYLLHLKFQQSWNAHPLGYFAVPVIIYRMYSLIKYNFFNPLNYPRNEH